MKNLKQFGVEYHETKHRKQEKKHLNNQASKQVYKNLRAKYTD